MRMDAAYYEELAGQLYSLLISLDDRIGSEQARLLYHFIEVGEHGLAMEEIADTLAQLLGLASHQRGAAAPEPVHLGGDRRRRAEVASPGPGPGRSFAPAAAM